MNVTLFYNAKIYTLTESFPIADWILAMGETIVAIGNREQRPADVETAIDLEGAVVIPGFIDAHFHLARYSLQIAEANSSTHYPWFRVDLSSIKTLSQLQEKLQAIREKITPGEWILGGCLNLTGLDSPITLAYLDTILSDNPALLIDQSLHSAIANSCALRLGNIHTETWSPEGGVIAKDSNQEPNGYVYETALRLWKNLIPYPPKKLYCDYLIQAMQQLNSLGIVGIHDLEPSPENDVFPLLSQILQNSPEKYSLRCVSVLKYESLQEYLAQGLYPHFGGDYLKVAGLKLIHDGALGAGTALMSERYHESGHEIPYWGEEFMARSTIRQAAFEMCSRNIPLVIHGIGDQATRNIADILEECCYKYPQKRLRHRVEHMQTASMETIQRLARCGAVFSVQPLHAPWDLVTAKKVQPHQVANTHRYRRMLQAAQENSLELALGTDAPVVPANPLYTIYSAVTRKFFDGSQLPEDLRHPEDCLTIAEAVRAYTLGAAFAAQEEHRKGSLSPGKLADFIVLSGDLLQYQDCPEKILDVKILATYVGGRQVFSCNERNTHG